MVSAHAADFVWRAADAIATVTAGGGVAKVVAINENNFMRRKVGSDQTVKPGHGRGGAPAIYSIKPSHFRSDQSEIKSILVFKPAGASQVKRSNGRLLLSTLEGGLYYEPVQRLNRA